MLLIQRRFQLGEHLLHLRNTHGLEDVVVHGGLNSALRKLKFCVAADDDDVNVLLKPARQLGELDAVHSLHRDVGDQHVDRVGLQVFIGLFTAGAGMSHLKVRRIFFDDALYKAQSGQFVVHQQDLICHEDPSLLPIARQIPIYYTMGPKKEKALCRILLCCVLDFPNPGSFDRIL